MRFCDVLRVKSEFPINLWPNAVYVYHARIRSFVESGETWEHFGRALLTSQGSDFRDAEVNFFRATDRRGPEGWAEAGLHMGRCPQAVVLTGKKIGIIISNNLQKQRKEKPSYDERSSTGKAGCGKSARPV